MAAALSAKEPAPSNPPQLSLIPDPAPKGDRPSCPHCGSVDVQKEGLRGRNKEWQRWSCKSCKNWFQTEV